MSRIGLDVLLPFSNLADPGGAECMMMLSRAKIVLVLPVPGGPCRTFAVPRAQTTACNC